MKFIEKLLPDINIPWTKKTMNVFYYLSTSTKRTKYYTSPIKKNQYLAQNYDEIWCVKYYKYYKVRRFPKLKQGRATVIAKEKVNLT